MTKRREPLTYQHTLTKAAALIGWDRIAHLCGVTPRAVRNWSEPDTEAEIRLIDAERIDRACVERGASVAPFYHLFGLRLDIHESGSTPASIHCAAKVAAKEAGEAVAALVDAIGSTDLAVRRRARTEAEEAIHALTAALAALDNHALEQTGRGD